MIGSLELSDAGKAMTYFEITDFDLHLSPTSLAQAAETLTTPDPDPSPNPTKE